MPALSCNIYDVSSRTPNRTNPRRGRSIEDANRRGHDDARHPPVVTRVDTLS